MLVGSTLYLQKALSVDLISVMDDIDASQAIKTLVPLIAFVCQENKSRKGILLTGISDGEQGGGDDDSLVGLLHVGSVGALSTVVGLDGEGVLLLQLTVQLVLGPDHPLAGGLVQHHRLEGDVLPVDPEAADLP